MGGWRVGFEVTESGVPKKCSKFEGGGADLKI